MQGLQQFFAVAMAARGRRVAMPSRAVDTAWHEFILSTQAYQRFCRQVLGRFLHHTPAEAMPSGQGAPDDLRRVWRLACQDEDLNPRSPARLPLLFALDAKLAIPGGFFYSRNCRQGQAAVGVGGAMIYCVSDFGSSGGGCSGGGEGSHGHGCGGHGCGGHGGCGGGGH